MRWGQRTMALELHSCSPLAAAQAHPADLDIVPRPLPKPIPVPSVDIVQAMEHLVYHAPSAVLRCYNGGICALVHGCLRAADLQHSHQLSLTPDAVVGVCWKMKRRPTSVPWAALRAGFSNRE